MINFFERAPTSACELSVSSCSLAFTRGIRIRNSGFPELGIRNPEFENSGSEYDRNGRGPLAGSFINSFYDDDDDLDDFAGGPLSLPSFRWPCCGGRMKNEAHKDGRERL